MSASIGFNAQNQFTVGGTALDYGRNFIMNGGFDYWNYATSQTTDGYGSDDRWVNRNVGSTKTHSMVDASDTERALFNSSKFSRTVVSSVASTGNYVSKRQFIENVTKLAGKTVTVSFWAKADSNKNIAIEFQQYFGTGGTPSTLLDKLSPNTISLSSSWKKYSVTITLPSIIGKSLGTDGIHTTSTGIRFWFDAGSTLDLYTNSLGQQSGTFDIAEVKLEVGTVATPWTPYEGEFGGEVQACKRYYEKGNLYRSGVIVNTTNGVESQDFTVEKRITPTVNADAVLALVNFTGASISSILGTTGFLHYPTGGTTNTQGRYQLTWSASAEL